MAMSIGGLYLIGEITRESFKQEASKVGLGVKLAMKHFDDMVAGFSNAMNDAKEEMVQQGFDNIDQIIEKIMQKGGIAKELCR